MAISSNMSGDLSAPMADINTTPLVDVMLVLFVIFLVTAPMLTHTVPLDLPSGSDSIAAEPPKIYTLSLDANQTLFWNNESVTQTELIAELSQLSTLEKIPPIDFYVDKSAPFERVSWVLIQGQQLGVTQISFVLEKQ
jgi:biopolymer transport protein ExbD